MFQLNHLFRPYSGDYTSVIFNFFKKFKSSISLILFIVPLLYITHNQNIINIPQVLNKVISKMNSGYKFMSSSNSSFNSRSRFGGMNKKSKELKFALKNGGELGGISNDGNTCFMNSVIQSLASSRQLLNFIDSYFYQEIEMNNGDKIIKIKSNQPNSELVFTQALKKLFDDVNGKYGNRGKEFSTKPILNKMPNGPKQNFFTGYNQEDAQEFYQLVMGLVETEYKKTIGQTDKKNNFKNDDEKYWDINQIPNLLSGCDDLGKLGNVYVPASQVDPNLVDADHKVFPLNLITPVDGVSAERIGCVACGEVGGIRYSVISGLSLNLPQKESYYSKYTLDGLMNDWITPEIIEDVNCNRCGLNQTKEFLNNKIEESTNETLIKNFKQRIELIDNELAKNHVSDEAFEKLTTKQMIRKTKKSKQILLSRPPPLLSMHINRSVFDPRTYMIVKNSSNVAFPAKFDLSSYVAEPKDINMDARLPFRKQDERTIISQQSSGNGVEDYPTSSESPSSDNSQSSESTPSEDINMKEDIVNANTASTDVSNNSMITEPANPKLVYDLKAVISHYGTHNYGHYICYRKLRGTWWRISDESVYVVTEDEVLNSQGTFMIFYEFNDGFKEILEPLDSDDEDQEPSNEKKSSSQELDNDSSDENSSSDDGQMNINNTSAKTDSLGNTIPDSQDEDEYESSGLSDDNAVNATKDADYNVGEERAFHI